MRDRNCEICSKAGGEWSGGAIALSLRWGLNVSICGVLAQIGFDVGAILAKQVLMISIRKAKHADIPSLATLLGYLFEQEKEFTPNVDKQTRGLDMIVSNASIGELLLAEREDGLVVGMVSLLYTVSTALGGKVALLEDMVVLPEERGKGHGSLLVEEAKKLAEERGCKRITLLTDFDDLAAERFYQKHGFTLSAMVPLRQILEK